VAAAHGPSSQISLAPRPQDCAPCVNFTLCSPWRGRGLHVALRTPTAAFFAPCFAWKSRCALENSWSSARAGRPGRPGAARAAVPPCPPEYFPAQHQLVPPVPPVPPCRPGSQSTSQHSTWCRPGRRAALPPRVLPSTASAGAAPGADSFLGHSHCAFGLADSGRSRILLVSEPLW
jgi:hypothetical protein